MARNLNQTKKKKKKNTKYAIELTDYINYKSLAFYLSQLYAVLLYLYSFYKIVSLLFTYAILHKQLDQQDMYYKEPILIYSIL